LISIVVFTYTCDGIILFANTIAELYPPLLHHPHIYTINTNASCVIMGFTGKRKRRFTRHIKSSANKKDSKTLREYVAAQAVPVTAHQPATRPEVKAPPPHAKQDLIDALEHTNSALTKAEADALEKDKCASKATKRAEDWKSVAVKERSEKKAAIKSKAMAEKELYLHNRIWLKRDTTSQWLLQMRQRQQRKV
jgi:hypothetical protein